MSSLSYYYGAPKTAANGTVAIGNQTHRLQGSLWMEHQWGNFRITEMPWATKASPMNNVRFGIHDL